MSRPIPQTARRSKLVPKSSRVRLPLLKGDPSRLVMTQVESIVGPSGEQKKNGSRHVAEHAGSVHAPEDVALLKAADRQKLAVVGPCWIWGWRPSQNVVARYRYG